MARLRSRSLLFVVAAASLWLASSGVLRADDAEARYQTTVEQAVREFSLNNWAEARALFRRAHELSPSARTLRGMGMAAFELKMYVEAQRELTEALANTARPLTDEQRTQVKALIDQSRAFVGRFELAIEPSQAQVKVDGQDAALGEGGVLVLSLGDHELTASAEGFQSARVPVRVEGGENTTLRVALVPVSSAPAAEPGAVAPPPPAQPAATRADAAADGGGTATTVGWIAAAGALAFGGGAAAFWFVGEGKYDDLQKQCGTSCSDAQIDDSGVKSSDLLTNVFLGLTGAAAVTSVVFFVIGANDGAHEPASSGATASLRVGPTSVQIEGSF